MRQRRPWLRRAPVVALLTLLAARPASARLVIEAGPPHLLGVELLAAPFAFTPAAFDVRARVVLTPSDEWNDRLCPPVYVGARSLDGTIVVKHSPPLSDCSLESIARAAGAAGAVGYLLYSGAAGLAFDPLPGWRYHHFWPGDSRSLPHPPAADITHRGAQPLMDALLAGADVRARFARSETVWAALPFSPAWVARDVLLGAQHAVLVELLVNRLRAFYRADGRLSPGIAQAVLLLELAAQLLRLGIRCSHGPVRVPYPVWLILFIAYVSIGVVAGTLFLLYWAQAAWPSADVDGARFASPTLAHSPRARRRLLAFVAAIAALDVGTGACWFFSAPQALEVVQVGTGAVLLPLLVLALSLHTHWRARKVLTSLPPGVARRLTRAMGCTNLASAIALFAGMGLPAAMVRPWANCVVVGVFHTALNGSAAVHATTFAPLGRELAPWPLERASRALLAAAARLCSLAWRAVRRLCRCVASGALSAEARRTPHSLVSTAHTQAVFTQQRPRSHIIYPTAQSRPSAAAAGATAAATVTVALPEAAELAAERPHLLLGVQLGYVRALQAELGAPRGVASYQIGLLARQLSASPAARRLRGLGGPAAGPSSLVEMVEGRRTADGSAAVARANLFVSHAQACDFDAMLSAIELYARIHDLKPTDTYLWIDVLCMRQGTTRQEVRHIGDVVRATGRVVLVLQPWTAPVCLTRAWCLFEVLIAALEELPIGLALPTDELRAVAAALARDRSAFVSALTTFDVRSSMSSVEEDRHIIFGLLEALFDEAEADAADKFNRATHAAMRQALAGFSWSAAV